MVPNLSRIVLPLVALATAAGVAAWQLRLKTPRMQAMMPWAIVGLLTSAGLLVLSGLGPSLVLFIILVPLTVVGDRVLRRAKSEDLERDSRDLREVLDRLRHPRMMDARDGDPPAAP